MSSNSFEICQEARTYSNKNFQVRARFNKCLKEFDLDSKKLKYNLNFFEIEFELQNLILKCLFYSVLFTIIFIYNNGIYDIYFK